MKLREKGFTLMELMVVIVIVAILAAVAVPLYVNYVDDAKRTEAKGAIGAIITAEQTYFQLNGTYVVDTFPGGVGTSLNVDLNESSKSWGFVMSPGAKGLGDGFRVVATNTAKPSITVTLDYSRSAAPVWLP